MNIRNIGLAFALAAVAVFSSCDDGLIEEKTKAAEHTGYTIKLTGRINGVDTWDDTYNLVLAAFSENSEYAIVQQKVPTTAADGTTMTIYDVDASATTVELCVTDILRRRILTLKSMDITTEANPRDTVTLAVGDIDASMFDAIQLGVFNTTCASCHGESSSAAASLYLTEGHAYSNLVNVASTRITDGIRVIPNDSANSVLHKVLYGDITTLHYDHKGLIGDSKVLSYIDRWIQEGAKE